MRRDEMTEVMLAVLADAVVSMCEEVGRPVTRSAAGVAGLFDPDLQGVTVHGLWQGLDVLVGRGSLRMAWVRDGFVVWPRLAVFEAAA